jgi:hypothetical protein
VFLDGYHSDFQSQFRCHWNKGSDCRVLTRRQQPSQAGRIRVQPPRQLGFGQTRLLNRVIQRIDDPVNGLDLCRLASKCLPLLVALKILLKVIPEDTAYACHVTRPLPQEV